MNANRPEIIPPLHPDPLACILTQTEDAQRLLRTLEIRLAAIRTIAADAKAQEMRLRLETAALKEIL